jgi:hypothetical protein
MMTICLKIDIEMFCKSESIHTKNKINIHKFHQNPALAAWLWLVMKHEEQKSRLQKYLKGKQLGVRINEDAIYIQQV